MDHPLGADALKPLAELDCYPALALRGEPGIAKSTALTLEHESLTALAAARNLVSIHVDLKVSSSEERLCRQIFDHAAHLWSLEIAAVVAAGRVAPTRAHGPGVTNDDRPTGSGPPPSFPRPGARGDKDRREPFDARLVLVVEAAGYRAVQIEHTESTPASQ
ncbi:MAG: hypothetical protein ABSC06_39665, partial [Rhodopila sp.]